MNLRRPLPKIIQNVILLPGGHKENETKVLLLGRGHEPSGGKILEKTLPQQRGQAQRGHSRKRYPLFCLRIHERESLPTDERTL